VKISEVVVGEQYGAHDNPGRGLRGGDPRQVEVLEIVTIEEEYWLGGGFTGERAKRNVRRVKVKVLDSTDKQGWRYVKIATAAKDAVLTIEARQLVGKWADLRPAILARIQKEQERQALQAELEARVKKAGFKVEWGAVEVNAQYIGGRGPVIAFRGKAVEKLLTKLGV
jgi:hypothetical protein